MRSSRASTFKSSRLSPAIVPPSREEYEVIVREERYNPAQIEDVSKLAVFGSHASRIYEKISVITYPSGEYMVKTRLIPGTMKTDMGTMVEVVQFILEYIINSSYRREYATLALKEVFTEGLLPNVDEDTMEFVIDFITNYDGDYTYLFEDLFHADESMTNETVKDIQDYATWGAAVLELSFMADEDMRIPWDFARDAMLVLRDEYMSRVAEEDPIPVGIKIHKPCPSCGHKEISMQAKQIRGLDEGATDFFMCCKCKITRNDVSSLSIIRR